MVVNGDGWHERKRPPTSDRKNCATKNLAVRGGFRCITVRISDRENGNPVYAAEWAPQTIRKFILDPARVMLMDKELRQESLGRE